MILQKKIQEVENKNKHKKWERERNEECTFTPNIYSNKKGSKWSQTQSHYKMLNKSENVITEQSFNDDYNRNSCRRHLTDKDYINRPNINQVFNKPPQQHNQNNFILLMNESTKKQQSNNKVFNNEDPYLSDKKYYQERFSQEVLSTGKKYNNMINNEFQNSLRKLSKQNNFNLNNQTMVSIKEETDERHIENKTNSGFKKINESSYNLCENYASFGDRNDNNRFNNMLNNRNPQVNQFYEDNMYQTPQEFPGKQKNNNSNYKSPTYSTAKKNMSQRKIDYNEMSSHRDGYSNKKIEIERDTSFCN